MEPRVVIQVLALVALLAKLLCAALTRGTNDLDSFYNFGRTIWENGLLTQYRTAAEFNHPPLTGWYCALIYGLGKGAGFHFLLRLPGIVADWLAVQLALRLRGRLGQPPWWALGLFALSPISFMVSGFHGNVDSILTLLMLLAVCETVRNRPAWSGGWLGLACQVKIIPLLIAPVLFFHWSKRERARPFVIAAAIVVLIGWSLPLCTIPQIFLRQVLGYSSNWGSWGITYWLTQSGAPAFAPVGFAGFTAVQENVLLALKLGIVGLVLWIAWIRRGLPAAAVFSTVALAWAIFFTLAPGVGAQYLVWLAPFLLLHSARCYFAVTAASAIFLFVFYNTISGGLPWYHGHSTAELLPVWVPWANLPWMVIALLFVAALRRSASDGRARFPSAVLPNEANGG
jgi:Gpi18-like mannosyltransferase